MISKSAAEVAISLAASFDARRIALTAVGGTPLATLVSSSTMADLDQVGAAEYVPNADLISSVASGYLENGESRHSQELDALVRDLVPLVAQHLDFAKNVVRPVISEVVDAVTQDIANLPVDVQFHMEIVKRGLPAPLASNAIVEMAEKYKDTPYEAIRSYVPMSPKSFADVVELMTTGAADTDEAVAVWATQKGEAFIQSVMSAVFSAEPSEYRFDQLIQSQDEGLDAAVIIFLIAEKIMNDPEEGIGMALVDYNQLVADIRNQAALRIVHGIENYTRSVANGTLITRIEQNYLVVNEDAYTRWQANGGVDAVLFGSVMSDRPARFEFDLNERALEFKALWEQRNRILTATERNNRFTNYTSILRSRGALVIANNMATIFAEVANGQQVSKELPVVARALTLIDEFVATLVEADFKDMWALVTKMVCRSAFHYTDAEKILTGIDQACKDNPGIEVREAALISTIEYVTDWVSDMIQASDF